MSKQMSRPDERLDELEAKVEALLNAREYLLEELEEVKDENERLREEVAELKGTVTPNPAAKPYNEKTRDEKVFELRVALARQAAGRNGRAAKTYSEVQSLFGNHPSAGHAYTLMQLAAGWDEETKTSTYDGFTYDATSTETIRITANLDAVNDNAVFHAANKARGGESR